MHGQKKRRKRTVGGLVVIDDYKLRWSLLSEPQSTTRGLIGLRITVRSEDEGHRELILEYPFPDKHTGNGAYQIPQRPKFSVKTVESDVQRAIASGWIPAHAAEYSSIEPLEPDGPAVSVLSVSPALRK